MREGRECTIIKYVIETASEIYYTKNLVLTVLDSEYNFLVKVFVTLPHI